MTKAGFLSEQRARRQCDAGGHYCPANRRPFVLLTAILASSLGFIDGSVVAIAVPAIRSDLAASFVQVQWIYNSYILVLSALILVGGAAGDRFGQRDVFGAGIVVFTLASIWCSVAQSAEGLIVARAVQGAGAAFMVPGSLALIARNYPREIRGRAIGTWAAASGISSALGPVLGGFILTSGGDSAWRILFLINAPIGALTLALLILRVPRDRPERAGAIDFTGACLVTAALGSLAYALTRLSGADEIGWAAAAWAVLGLAAVTIFIWWEGRVAEPMIPLQLFRSAAFSGANALTFLLYFGLSGVLFFLPVTLITAWQLPESQAGFIFLPFTIMMAGLSRYAGALADRIGARLPMVLGSTVSGAAFVIVAIVLPGRAFWTGIIPAMLVLGAGLGLVVPVLSTAIMQSVEECHAGAASGINNAVARMSSLFAVAGLGVVAALWFAANLEAGGQSSLAHLGGFGIPPSDPALQPAFSRAMIASTQAICVVTAGLAFLAAGVGWFTQPHSQADD